MARIDIAQLTTWITAAAVAHGQDLPAYLMQRLGCSRRRAGQVLKRLTDGQWLHSLGTPRRPLYRPGALRQVVMRYPLLGLQEDLPWRQDFVTCFQLPPAVEAMARHALTELLNNAIDHSGGTQVTVSMRQTPLQLQLLVSDDGCGLFQRIAESFAIDDPRLALLELSKGKLTSAPDGHSGHGIFFTSRLADVFDLHANASAFQCRVWEGRHWRAGRAGSVAARPGTSIYLAIALDTSRTLGSVLQAHSSSGAGFDFARTQVPLHLLAGDGSVSMLASRAEARRVAQRLSQFSAAELDFAGVQTLGHGFADELFRVFRLQHPGVQLLPVGMSPPVAAMVDSVRAAVRNRQALTNAS